MNRINNSDEKLQLKEEGSPSLHDIHNISFTIMNLYRKNNSNLSHHWQDILVWAKVVINWLSDVAIPTAMRIHFPMITIYLARHTLLITYFSFCAFLWCVRGGESLKRDWETNRVRQTLCMVSPPCRVVKHIKGWLDCTGQLLWHKDAPHCQTHRCRVMSHCVLEFCQKPASLFSSHVLHLCPVILCFLLVLCL